MQALQEREQLKIEDMWVVTLIMRADFESHVQLELRPTAPSEFDAKRPLAGICHRRTERESGHWNRPGQVLLSQGMHCVDGQRIKCHLDGCDHDAFTDAGTTWVPEYGQFVSRPPPAGTCRPVSSPSQLFRQHLSEVCKTKRIRIFEIISWNF